MQGLKGIGPYATLGLDMVLAIVVGLLGGRWLDQRLGTRGWLMVIGFLFGVAASFNILFKAARRLREETEREEREQAKQAQDDAKRRPQDADDGRNDPS
jgi:F0F1-type ATP synthase assembly protein I